jgi:hypothetical protein
MGAMIIDYEEVKALYDGLYGQASTLTPAQFNRLIDSAVNFFIKETGWDTDGEAPDDVIVGIVDIVRAIINGDFAKEKIGDYSYDRGDAPPMWRQIVDQYRRYSE